MKLFFRACTPTCRAAFLLAGILLTNFLPKARSQVLIDVETGAVFPGRTNQIQIPQTAPNTRFDAFGPGFESRPVLNFRARLGYTFHDRHTISVLYAPYTTTATYKGQETAPIIFNNLTFVPANGLKVGYRFNGYRFTYRYDFIRTEPFRLGAGLTLNIRDAYVEVEDATQKSRYSNVGPVPLLNLYARWQPTERFGTMLETDAFGSSRGRAVDVLAALTYRLADRLHLKAGYRLLDGKADSEKTYTLFQSNSAVVGIRYGL
ncbi:hypothetical protein [Larkinella soli]|uniref:hypothetical protein n=1 Tax=Larkinella soli TaxID=1770527 RepID=UPI000FFC2CF9|nr:hypothetical protein [Larkinella soli]